MELKPTEPPGHARRKLRALVSEISRLRTEGYTIRAIHEALAAAGVEVGWATVQREVARLAQPSHAATPPRQSAPKPTMPTAPGKSSGKLEKPKSSPRVAADVDSYFDQHTTNPLFRKKDKR